MEQTNPKPEITVIIPLYNKEATIDRAINSVLNQTFPNFELLIINDGSTDQSLEMALSHSSDSRVRIISQSNVGLPATRNRGIKEASADFISFLDADDEWHSDFLETIYRMYKQYPNGGIYATSHETCIANRVRCHKSPSIESDFEGVLPSYFDIAAEFPFVSISVGIPKSVFEVCGYFNPNTSMSEDNEMWTKIALHYPVIYSSKVCTRYYKYVKNQMTQTYYSMPSDPIQSFISSLPTEYLASCEYSKGLMSYVDKMVLGTAYFNIGAGDMKSARNLCRSVHSKEVQVKKYILLIVTLFPGFVGRSCVQLRNKLLYLQYMITWDKISRVETNS